MVMASAKQTETQVTTTLGEAQGEYDFFYTIDHVENSNHNSILTSS